MGIQPRGSTSAMEKETAHCLFRANENGKVTRCHGHVKRAHASNAKHNSYNITPTDCVEHAIRATAQGKPEGGHRIYPDA
tara:strand:+ start:871 stop:1110 length:240 start_codon:yes stop_codon:yes gene_type:complete